MGDGDYSKKSNYFITPKQMKRMRFISPHSQTTRIVTGGMERITYKEKVNGVTVIRTRWRQKKKKERKKHS